MRHAVVTPFLSLAVAGLLAGCPDRSISELDPVPAGAATKNIPVSADLDILFVIDNSASTRDKQTIFAENYPRFVQALDAFPTGRPNLHIAVVTTSVDVGAGSAIGPACHPASGENGTLQNASRDTTFVCAAPTTDRYLSDIAQADGTRKINYTPPLETALSCISHVGDSGCGFEAPLEAMKRALDGSRPENAGFVRPGAFLAVVFLTDEDDCSALPQLFQQSEATVGKEDFRCGQTAYHCDRPISPSAPGVYTGCTVRHDSFLINPTDYTQFLLGLKGNAGVAVALIAGDPTTEIHTGPVMLIGPMGPQTQQLAVQPSCMATINGNLALGRPSLRLNEMLAGFGDRGLFRTVCQSDYSAALADIGALLFAAVSPCLEGTLDTRDIDTANPGLQPDCTVSDIEAPDTAQQVETEIPRCHMMTADQPDIGSDAACWWVAQNAPACATETKLELRVERKTQAAPNTTVRVSCATTAPVVVK